MPTSAPLGSVLIPAHNEAAVIKRCLDALLADFAPGEIDVVVACNGCDDGTRDVVRSSGHPVQVVEIPVASKTAALRAGEEVLTTFPRLYLDADVILPSSSAKAVLDCLRSGRVSAARPPIKYGVSNATLLVRSYYRARAQVPTLQGGLWGAGIYGLSAEGRSRFGVHPDVTADDLFVDQLFERSEVEILACAPVMVNVPRNCVVLLRVLRRTYRGNAEHRDRTPGLTSSTRETVRQLLKGAAGHPGRVVDTLTYMAVAAIARLTLMTSTSVRWERDDSSRNVLLWPS